MPVTITKEAYTIDELSDAARAKALDAHREWNVDHDWWDCTYEQAADAAAKYLGLDIRTKRVQLRNGTHRYDPAINFSGFWPQGDGASFSGWFTLNDVDAAALKADFGTDAELHAIADTLEELKSALTALEVTASITRSGRYSHEYSMHIEVDDYEEPDDEVIAAAMNAIYKSLDVEATITEAMRDFARWIYRMLEQEYEYLTSDEAILESLQCNELLFDEDGDSI